MPKTHVISYSELDTFRQCNHKHLLGYKERWTAPGTSPALARGTLWHIVMESHYKILKVWGEEGRPRALPITLVAHAADTNNIKSSNVLIPIEQALHKAAMAHLYEQGSPVSEHSELVEWMYSGYIELFGLDEEWKILAVEHAPVMWLPTERGTRSSFRIKMKLDLIVKWDGKIWIVDHKSGKDLPTEKMLDIDDQFSLYTWGLRKLGKRVFGQVHNAARTQRNVSKPQPLDERFGRTRLYRTDRELDTVAIEAYQTCREAYGPLNKGQRAPDSDRCRWRCDFTEPCLHGRKGGDEKQFLLDLGFVQDFTRH